MFYKRKRNKKGFTLVEILLALAILGIGIVSILSLFAVGVHSARRTLNRTRASLLAQMTFEEIKYLNIRNGTHSLLSTGQHDETVINAVSTKPSGYTNPDFTRSLDVSSGGIPNLKKLVLTVSWDSTSEVFVTYLAKVSP